MFVNREKRLVQERQIESLKSQIREENINRERNIWFQKKNTNVEHFKRESAEAQRKIVQRQTEERRARLRRLLNEEDQLFKKELFSQVRSVDDIHEEIKRKVEILKEKSEKERKQEVERLLDIQFRSNKDALRAIDQKYKEIKTKIEREIQMKEKLHRINRSKTEEKIYAQISEQELREQILEERRLRSEYLEKIRERNVILGEQLKEIQEKKRDELEQRIEENKLFKQKCESQKQEEAQKVSNIKEANRRIAEEVKIYNQLQQQQKDLKIKQERELDQQQLNQDIEREQMLKAIEMKHKEKYRKEAHEFYQTVKRRAEDIRISQQIVDKLIAEEIERQFQKQQEVWDREEQARVRLLKEVYSHRYDQIEEKKALINAEKQMKEIERKNIESEVNRYEDDEKEQFLNELKKMRLYNEQIGLQIKDKLKERQKQLFIEMEEDRKIQLMELEHKQKLDKAMMEGQALIDEINKLRDMVI